MASTNAPRRRRDCVWLLANQSRLEFLWFDILAFTIPREKVISSKIDRSTMRGVDRFEDGFAQGWMRVNCCRDFVVGQL